MGKFLQLTNSLVLFFTFRKQIRLTVIWKGTVTIQFLVDQWQIGYRD